LWFYPFKKHYILCFLWFFAQAEPSAWLNNAKKPVFSGFFAKQEAGKRRLAKAVSDGTLSADFADQKSPIHLRQSASSADSLRMAKRLWTSYFSIVKIYPRRH
jgi:hypothetical protein